MMLGHLLNCLNRKTIRKIETMKNLKNTLTVAATLAQHLPGNTPWEIAAFVEDLDKMGAALRRRYEAQCSYEWANTEAYEKRTDKMEAKLQNMATEFVKGTSIGVKLQRDPRGWPVVIGICGSEFYLGGR